MERNSLYPNRGSTELNHSPRNISDGMLGSGANSSMLSVFLPAVFKSSSEHRIPECRRGLVFEAEAAEEELILVNTTKQFHSGNGDRSRGEVLESEHGAGSGLDAAVVLFDQVVQILRRPSARP